jgi:DNA-binding Lrp family transcriptional regulator
MVDRIDKIILVELTQNARESQSKIAKKVRVSKEVVNYRIKKLEEQGVIKNYYTIIDSKKLGIQSYRVLIKINSLDFELENKIIAYLKKLGTINYLVKIADNYDIALIFNEKDQNCFMEKYLDFMSKFSKYISKKEINIITNIKHFQIPYAKNKIELFADTSSSLKEKNVIQIKEKDRRILESISKNARFSYVTLSEKFNMKPNSMLYRIKSLEKSSIIQGYTTEIDWSKLGYVHYKVFLYLNELNKKVLAHFFSYLLEINGLIHITEVISNQDIEFEILCKNQLELIQIMNKIKEKFPGLIKETKSFVTLDVVEINYLQK